MSASRSRLARLLWKILGGGSEELELQVDEELKAHLEMLVEEQVAAGMSPVQARAAARKRFGDYGRVRAEGIRIRRGNEKRWRRADILSDLVADFRFAFRSLRRASAERAATTAPGPPTFTALGSSLRVPRGSLGPPTSPASPGRPRRRCGSRPGGSGRSRAQAPPVHTG